MSVTHNSDAAAELTRTRLRVSTTTVLWAAAAGARLFSRSASRVLHRHAVRPDLRAVLAAQRHPVLRAADRAAAAMVALHRRRVRGPRGRRARRRHAGAAVAGGVRHQLPGGVAQRLWGAADDRRPALVRHLSQCLALYRDHGRHRPGDRGAGRRLRADPGRRRAERLLAVLVALVSRQCAAEPHDRAGIPDLVRRRRPVVALDRVAPPDRARAARAGARRHLRHRRPARRQAVRRELSGGGGAAVRSAAAGAVGGGALRREGRQRRHPDRDGGADLADLERAEPVSRRSAGAQPARACSCS